MMTKSTSFEITPEIEALANRPYSIVIVHDADDGWIGRIPELPGHIAVGDTLDEMYTLAEDAKRAWIATALALDRPVPPPRPPDSAPKKSGKFVVRVPSPIHVALAQEAERHDISLNELVSNVLSLVVAAGFEGLVSAVTHRESANEWEMVKRRAPRPAAALLLKVTAPPVGETSEDRLVGMTLNDPTQHPEDQDRHATDRSD